MTPDAPAVPAFSPFPADVLPEPIRGFVTEAAKSIGCDPSYVALPLLSGLASAIGNTPTTAVAERRGTSAAPPGNTRGGIASGAGAADRGYVHDAWNRLVRATVPGAVPSKTLGEYEYNGQHWRTV